MPEPTRLTIGLGKELSERLDRLAEKRNAGLFDNQRDFEEARRRERQALAFSALSFGVRELEYRHGLRRRPEAVRQAANRLPPGAAGGAAPADDIEEALREFDPGASHDE